MNAFPYPGDIVVTAEQQTTIGQLAVLALGILAVVYGFRLLWERLMVSAAANDLADDLAAAVDAAFVDTHAVDEAMRAGQAAR